MQDWRNEMLSDIKEAARKKVKRRNFLKNDLIGILVGIIGSSVVVAPAYFKLHASLLFCVIIVLIISLFSYFLFNVGIDHDDSWEIETEVEKQAQKIFPVIAEKTEMYPLSSVYSYKDLKDTYCKKQQNEEHVNLQTIQENIQKRNRDILIKTRRSIIDGTIKHTICPVCKGSIKVKNDTLIKTCFCKGVQMYQKEQEKKSL